MGNLYPIIESNHFSYNYYQKLCNKYNERDSRELNYQNRIIIVFLEKLFINTVIDVVDVSSLYYRGPKSSKKHDNFQYSKRGKAPPDLLITKNWNLHNKENKVDYIAAIEIKSPMSNESIYNKSLLKYQGHVKNQLESHLSANSKVILTDCYRWQFFSRAEASSEPITIDLVDENGIWLSEKVEPSEFLKNEFMLENPIESEPEEWIKLQRQIISFCSDDISD